MTQMYYLDDNGKVVRQFIVRGKSEENTISSCSKIKDELSKVNATIIFERQISDCAYFMIASFDDQVMMAVWESMVIAIAMIDEVEYARVLIVKNSSNPSEAKEKCSAVRRLLMKHSICILSEEETEPGEYRLVVSKKLASEKTLGLEGT